MSADPLATPEAFDRVLQAKRSRGTTNKNVSGNSEDRKRRRAWLLETYRASEDVLWSGDGADAVPVRVPLGMGQPACWCYRCPTILTVDTLTVDRIIPGCLGGTYRRDNIRPACSKCNESTGGALARIPKPKRSKR